MLEIEMLKNFDDEYRKKYNLKYLCGIDEAGRGPLAGPVVAASVIFHQDTFIDGVNDSKKVTIKNREKLFEKIIESCVCYSIGIVDVEKIEEINILQSALLAMKNSVESLELSPEIILIDGNKLFQCNLPKEAIVKGDSKSFSIAAASILAKVTRDRIMRELHEKYPEYNWIKNKGYGTREHINAIHKYGVTEIHRKSFLKKIL